MLFVIGFPKMKKATPYSACLLVFLLGPLMGFARGETCRAVIDVRAAETGARISEFKYSVTSVGPKETPAELTRTGSGVEFEGFCEYYDVVILSPGYYPVQLTISALLPMQTLTVFLTSGQVTDEPIRTIRGKVEGVDAGDFERFLVKITRAAGEEHLGSTKRLHMDYRINPDGSFAVSGLQGGQYVVTLLEKGTDTPRLRHRLVHAELVDLPRGGPAEDVMVTITVPRQ